VDDTQGRYDSIGERNKNSSTINRMPSSLPLSVIDLELGQPSPNRPVNAVSQSSGVFPGSRLSLVISSGEPGILFYFLIS